MSEDTGTAPAFAILMPLYCAGLWLAVNVAPAQSRVPHAKYSSSVEMLPITVTSAPRRVAPSAKASMNSGEEGRMSPPTTTEEPVRPRTSTKAAPVARTLSAVMLSPTMPRTS